MIEWPDDAEYLPASSTGVAMSLEGTHETQLAEIRSAVKALCARYGEQYWLELDAVRGYPTEFVRELTQAGFLTALIPRPTAAPVSACSKRRQSWKRSAARARTRARATRRCT